MAATIKRVLARGDYVAVERGHLVIIPISGKSVPKDWLAKNLPAIMGEIAGATGINIFQYQRYHVGKFGVKNFEGVLLDYANIITGETCQVFYNCETTRARNTEAGKKGKPLPRNQFRVTANHAFTKLWQSLRLPLPRRLAEFHSCMGKLGAVYVTGTQNEKGRIDKTTFKPVNFTAGELIKAFSIIGTAPDNYLANSRQAPDNYPTKAPDKETAQSQVRQGFQANSSTDKLSTKLSNQVGAHKAMPLDRLSVVVGTTNDQSIDEWLADYDQHATSHLQQH